MAIHVDWKIRLTYWFIDPILLYLSKYIFPILFGCSIVGLPFKYIFNKNNNQNRYIKWCKYNNIKIFVWGSNCDKETCVSNGIWCETDS